MNILTNIIYCISLFFCLIMAIKGISIFIDELTIWAFFKMVLIIIWSIGIAGATYVVKEFIDDKA